MEIDDNIKICCRYNGIKSASISSEVDNTKTCDIYNRPQWKHINRLTIYAAYDSGQVGCNKDIVSVTASSSMFGKWYDFGLGFGYRFDIFDECTEYIINKIVKFDFNKGR